MSEFGWQPGMWAVLACTLVAVPAAMAAEVPATSLAEAQAMERDCLDQLMAGAGDIDCAFPTYMEDREKAAIAKITRDEFKDARCMITVKLARSVIDAVVKAEDGRVKVPSQSVNCTLETKSGTIPVTFNFAPHIDFKAGAAVTANPGMGEVTGVSRWLAWPVVTYVNGSTDLRKVMLRIVNAFIQRQREARAL